MEQRLRRHVQTLARDPRTPGSPEHRVAGEYIRRHLEQSGFGVEEAPVREAGLPGLNLLTRPLPERDGLPLLIVGAHYDSVPGSPGADDNASGVAALLELAAAIYPFLESVGQFGCRLQLAAYDLEEYGYVGSSSHCDQLHREGVPVRGMISLEMLGYADPRPGSQKLPPQLVGLYPEVGDFIGVCGNEASAGLVRAVTGAMKSVEGLPVESIAVPGNGEALPAVRLSDHSPFWDRGYEALMITDTAFMRNPHYHQPTDTPDTLDYAFLARVTAGVDEVVRRLLKKETSHK
jgi:aminopeptidase YwaD